MSHAITIQARHAPMLHEGGTKHYAVVMISVMSSTAQKAYHLTMRIHGAVGKASRVTCDAFADYNEAYSAYKKAIDAKVKRGYKMSPLEEATLLQKTYEDADSAKDLFDKDEVRALFSTTKFTKNSKMESLTSLLPTDDADEMVDAMEVMTGNSSDVNIDLLFRKANAAAAEKEAKAAQKAAIQAIEEKRSEAYGENWGSW